MSEWSVQKVLLLLGWLRHVLAQLKLVLVNQVAPKIDLGPRIQVVQPRTLLLHLWLLNRRVVAILLPISYEKAVSSDDKDKWNEATVDDPAIIIQHTWESVDKPKGQKVEKSELLYKLKDGLKRNDTPRYKENGFTKRSGRDYHEVFSHVVKHSSIPKVGLKS